MKTNRTVSKLLLTIILLAFFAALAPINVQFAHASTVNTIVITGNTADGLIVNATSTTWTNKRNALTGTPDTANTTITVGSTLPAGELYRGYLYFDISSLPLGAVIQSATLSVNVAASVLSNSNNFTLQTGLPTYPSATLTNTDFNQAYYTNTAGTANSSTIVGAGYWNITLNTVGLADIADTADNHTGAYKLCMRTSDDIADTISGVGSDYITFYSADQGAAQAPKLYITYVGEPYTYTFAGVYDEGTGIYTGACNITVYFDGLPAQNFLVNGSRAATFTQVPLYCEYDLSPYPRQYWFLPDENATTLYIYNDVTTSYVINFLDYTGLLKTYPYIEAQVNVGGSLVTVDKRKVDVQNSVAMSLVNGRKYSITIGNVTNYSFGELLMTATTAVQLVLKSADFPKESLLTQKNVHIYAVRNFTTPTGYISTYYEDYLNQTTSVAIVINYANGSTAYSTTFTNSSFILNWMNADNATGYTLTATITHALYGTLTWRQVFMEEGGTEAPFSLGFLGDFPFESAYLLPAVIILFVAGCFSALNAEVGAVLVCIVAIFLTWMGWIPIPAGSLVAGLFFAILMALIYNKRRVVLY